jgi:site-specific recombinase XerD
MTDIRAIEKTTGAKLAAQAQKINDGIKEVIAASLSPASRRAYAGHLKRFNAFCVKFGLSALPASAETVAAYVTACVQDKKSASYIDQLIAAIASVHRKAGLDDVTRREVVRAAVKGARRILTVAPKKKAAATIEVIKCLLDGIDRSTLQGKRDAALILLGFAGAFRRSELAALDVEDMEKITTDSGKAGYLITIKHSKTDQEGRGMIKGIFPTKTRGLNPVIAIDEYLAAAGITTGALFRRVLKGGHVSPDRITGQSVALVIKAAAKQADVTLDVSGHSLRSGFITSALSAGQSERSVMNQSGHKSVTIMRGYQQRANALQDNAAAGLAGLM